MDFYDPESPTEKPDDKCQREAAIADVSDAGSLKKKSSEIRSGTAHVARDDLEDTAKPASPNQSVGAQQQWDVMIDLASVPLPSGKAPLPLRNVPPSPHSTVPTIPPLSPVIPPMPPTTSAPDPSGEEGEVLFEGRQTKKKKKKKKKKYREEGKETLYYEVEAVDIPAVTETLKETGHSPSGVPSDVTLLLPAGSSPSVPTEMEMKGQVDEKSEPQTLAKKLLSKALGNVCKGDISQAPTEESSNASEMTPVSSPLMGKFKFAMKPSNLKKVSFTLKSKKNMLKTPGEEKEEDGIKPDMDLIDGETAQPARFKKSKQELFRPDQEIAAEFRFKEQLIQKSQTAIVLALQRKQSTSKVLEIGSLKNSSDEEKQEHHKEQEDKEASRKQRDQDKDSSREKQSKGSKEFELRDREHGNSKEESDKKEHKERKSVKNNHEVYLDQADKENVDETIMGKKLEESNEMDEHMDLSSLDSKEASHALAKNSELYKDVFDEGGMEPKNDEHQRNQADKSKSAHEGEKQDELLCKENKKEHKDREESREKDLCKRYNTTTEDRVNRKSRSNRQDLNSSKLKHRDRSVSQERDSSKRRDRMQDRRRNRSRSNSRERKNRHRSRSSSRDRAQKIRARLRSRSGSREKNWRNHGRSQDHEKNKRQNRRNSAERCRARDRNRSSSSDSFEGRWRKSSSRSPKKETKNKEKTSMSKSQENSIKKDSNKFTESIAVITDPGSEQKKDRKMRKERRRSTSSETTEFPISEEKEESPSSKFPLNECYVNRSSSIETTEFPVTGSGLGEKISVIDQICSTAELNKVKNTFKDKNKDRSRSVSEEKEMANTKALPCFSGPDMSHQDESSDSFDSEYSSSMKSRLGKECREKSSKQRNRSVSSDAETQTVSTRFIACKEIETVKDRKHDDGEQTILQKIADSSSEDEESKFFGKDRIDSRNEGNRSEKKDTFLRHISENRNIKSSSTSQDRSNNMDRDTKPTKNRSDSQERENKSWEKEWSNSRDKERRSERSERNDLGNKESRPQREVSIENKETRSQRKRKNDYSEREGQFLKEDGSGSRENKSKTVERQRNDSRDKESRAWRNTSSDKMDEESRSWRKDRSDREKESRSLRRNRSDSRDKESKSQRKDRSDSREKESRSLRKNRSDSREKEKKSQRKDRSRSRDKESRSQRKDRSNSQEKENRSLRRNRSDSREKENRSRRKDRSDSREKESRAQRKDRSDSREKESRSQRKDRSDSRDKESRSQRKDRSDSRDKESRSQRKDRSDSREKESRSWRKDRSDSRDKESRSQRKDRSDSREKESRSQRKDRSDSRDKESRSQRKDRSDSRDKESRSQRKDRSDSREKEERRYRRKDRSGSREKEESRSRRKDRSQSRDKESRSQGKKRSDSRDNENRSQRKDRSQSRDKESSSQRKDWSDDRDKESRLQRKNRERENRSQKKIRSGSRENEGKSWKKDACSSPEKEKTSSEHRRKEKRKKTDSRDENDAFFNKKEEPTKGKDVKIQRYTSSQHESLHRKDKSISPCRKGVRNKVDYAQDSDSDIDTRQNVGKKVYDRSWRSSSEESVERRNRQRRSRSNSYRRQLPSRLRGKDSEEEMFRRHAKDWSRNQARRHYKRRHKMADSSDDEKDSVDSSSKSPAQDEVRDEEHPAAKVQLTSSAIMDYDLKDIQLPGEAPPILSSKPGEKTFSEEPLFDKAELDMDSDRICSENRQEPDRISAEKEGSDMDIDESDDEGSQMTSHRQVEHAVGSGKQITTDKLKHSNKPDDIPMNIEDAVQLKEKKMPEKISFTVKSFAKGRSLKRISTADELVDYESKGTKLFLPKEADKEDEIPSALESALEKIKTKLDNVKSDGGNVLRLSEDEQEFKKSVKSEKERGKDEEIHPLQLNILPHDDFPETTRDFPENSKTLEASDKLECVEAKSEDERAENMNLLTKEKRPVDAETAQEDSKPRSRLFHFKSVPLWELDKDEDNNKSSRLGSVVQVWGSTSEKQVKSVLPLSLGLDYDSSSDEEKDSSPHKSPQKESPHKRKAASSNYVTEEKEEKSQSRFTNCSELNLDTRKAKLQGDKEMSIRKGHSEKLESNRKCFPDLRTKSQDWEEGKSEYQKQPEDRGKSSADSVCSKMTKDTVVEKRKKSRISLWDKPTRNKQSRSVFGDEERVSVDIIPTPTQLVCKEKSEFDQYVPGSLSGDITLGIDDCAKTSGRISKEWPADDISSAPDMFSEVYVSGDTERNPKDTSQRESDHIELISRSDSKKCEGHSRNVSLDCGEVCENAVCKSISNDDADFVQMIQTETAQKHHRSSYVVEEKNKSDSIDRSEIPSTKLSSDVDRNPEVTSSSQKEFVSTRLVGVSHESLRERASSRHLLSVAVPNLVEASSTSHDRGSSVIYQFKQSRQYEGQEKGGQEDILFRKSDSMNELSETEESEIEQISSTQTLTAVVTNAPDDVEGPLKLLSSRADNEPYSPSSHSPTNVFEKHGANIEGDTEQLNRGANTTSRFSASHHTTLQVSSTTSTGTSESFDIMVIPDAEQSEVEAEKNLAYLPDTNVTVDKNQLIQDSRIGTADSTTSSFITKSTTAVDDKSFDSIGAAKTDSLSHVVQTGSSPRAKIGRFGTANWSSGTKRRDRSLRPPIETIVAVRSKSAVSSGIAASCVGSKSSGMSPDSVVCQSSTSLGVQNSLFSIKDPVLASQACSPSLPSNVPILTAEGDKSKCVSSAETVSKHSLAKDRPSSTGVSTNTTLLELSLKDQVTNQTVKSSPLLKDSVNTVHKPSGSKMGKIQIVLGRKVVPLQESPLAAASEEDFEEEVPESTSAPVPEPSRDAQITIGFPVMVLTGTRKIEEPEPSELIWPECRAVAAREAEKEEESSEEGESTSEGDEDSDTSESEQESSKEESWLSLKKDGKDSARRKSDSRRRESPYSRDYNERRSSRDDIRKHDRREEDSDRRKFRDDERRRRRDEEDRRQHAEEERRRRNREREREREWALEREKRERERERERERIRGMEREEERRRRRRSRSRSHSRDRSRDRDNSRSPDRWRSRERDRDRVRNRSSVTPERISDRSRNRQFAYGRSRSPNRYKLRSPDRFRNRSPDFKRDRLLDYGEVKGHNRSPKLHSRESSPDGDRFLVHDKNRDGDARRDRIRDRSREQSQCRDFEGSHVRSPNRRFNDDQRSIDRSRGSSPIRSLERQPGHSPIRRRDDSIDRYRDLNRAHFERKRSPSHDREPVWNKEIGKKFQTSGDAVNISDFSSTKRDVKTVPVPPPSDFFSPSVGDRSALTVPQDIAVTSQHVPQVGPAFAQHVEGYIDQQASWQGPGTYPPHMDPATVQMVQHQYQTMGYPPDQALAFATQYLASSGMPTQQPDVLSQPLAQPVVHDPNSFTRTQSQQMYLGSDPNYQSHFPPAHQPVGYIPAHQPPPANYPPHHAHLPYGSEIYPPSHMPPPIEPAIPSSHMPPPIEPVIPYESLAEMEAHLHAEKHPDPREAALFGDLPSSRRPRSRKLKEAAPLIEAGKKEETKVVEVKEMSVEPEKAERELEILVGPEPDFETSILAEPEQGQIRSEDISKSEPSTKEVNLHKDGENVVSSTNSADTPDLTSKEEQYSRSESKPLKVKSRWRRNSEAEATSSTSLPLVTKRPVQDSQEECEQGTEDANQERQVEKEEATPPPPPPRKRLRLENEAEYQEKSKTEAGDNYPVFEAISENIHLTQRKRSKSMKRMVCDCTTTKADRARGILACGEDCLNRMLMIECGSRCPCINHCSNKRFQQKQYAKTEPFNCGPGKGWGMKASEDMPNCGTFVMEYVGELLDYKEFVRRSRQYARQGLKHHYFMALNADELIDATLKGSTSRFFNHSCDPNCETQKWTVNGELRVGFFTKKPVVSGEELTFDYQFEFYGEPQKCYCGAETCRGFIGGQKNQPVKKKKDKTVEKRKSGLFEDEMLDEDMEHMISLKDGMKNKAHVLELCRLMVRAEKAEHRQALLKLIQNTTELNCLRLFLGYQGLPLLWSWMVDVGLGDMEEDSKLKAVMLNVLKMLPITNRTVLKESRIMQIVEKWATVQTPAVPETETEADSNSEPLPLPVASDRPVVSILALHREAKDQKTGKKRVTFADEAASSDSDLSDSLKVTSTNENTGENVKVFQSDPADSSTLGLVSDQDEENFKTDTGDEISEESSVTPVTETESCTTEPAVVPAEVTEEKGGDNLDNSQSEMSEEPEDKPEGELFEVRSEGPMTRHRASRRPSVIPSTRGRRKGGRKQSSAEANTNSETDDGDSSKQKEVSSVGEKRDEDATDTSQDSDTGANIAQHITTDAPLEKKSDMALEFPHFQKDVDTKELHKLKIEPDVGDNFGKASELSEESVSLSSESDSTDSDMAANAAAPSDSASDAERSIDTEPALPSEATFTEVSYDVNEADEVSSLATELMLAWSELKELYKIPKKMRAQERRRTEMELDSADIKQPQKDEPDPYAKWKRKKVEKPKKKDIDDEELKKRNQALAGPKMSKEERRQLFEAQVKAEDEMNAERQRQQEALLQQQQAAAAYLIQQNPAFAALHSLATQGQVFDSSLQQCGSILTPEQQHAIMLATQASGGDVAVAAQQLMATPGLFPQSQDQFQQMQGMYAGGASAQMFQDTAALQQQQQLQQQQIAMQQMVLQQIGAPSQLALPLEEEDIPPPPSPPEAREMLPLHWKRASDAEGRPYFYHVHTRVTQWEPPKWDNPFPEDMDFDVPDLEAEDESQKKTTTAAADTSSEVARRLKEQFRKQMSHFVVEYLNPYRHPDCKVGHIQSTYDFKHLARRLTHHIMAKELKHCRHVEDLEVNENVKAKAKDYVKKYMSRCGPVFKKSSSPDDFA